MQLQVLPLNTISMQLLLGWQLCKANANANASTAHVDNFGLCVQ